MATQGNSGSASGGQLEEKIDFTKETDECVKQCANLVAAGALQEALQLLSALEKRCRTGNDNASLARVCETAVKSCKEAGDDEAVLQTLTTFSTKRSQKMAAIKALVTTALPWCVVDTYSPVKVANEAEKSVRDKLVANLRDITDGKLFLERERAQLTRAYATIKVRYDTCDVWNEQLGGRVLESHVSYMRMLTHNAILTFLCFTGTRRRHFIRSRYLARSAC